MIEVIRYVVRFPSGQYAANSLPSDGPLNDARILKNKDSARCG